VPMKAFAIVRANRSGPKWPPQDDGIQLSR